MEKRQVKLNNELTQYYITEDGKLYNEKTKRWYKGSFSGGYHKYDLVWKGKKYSKLTHRLIAEAFIPNPNNYPAVNHIDGNKLNNIINNLEWVTISENNFHAYNTGLKRRTNGRENRQKITEELLLNEEWKQYQNSNYYISRSGKAMNKKTGNLIKGKITKDGYVEWCFNINKKKLSLLAHRIVYEVFIGPLKEGLVINHKNGNKQDNSTQNLEQVSASNNIFHSYYEVGHKNVRKVGQYDLDGNLIKIYLSCADAARQNPGFYPNLISNVCNGKSKTHKGFIWKYID